MTIIVMLLIFLIIIIAIFIIETLNNIFRIERQQHELKYAIYRYKKDGDSAFKSLELNVNSLSKSIKTNEKDIKEFENKLHSKVAESHNKLFAQMYR